ncbi:hypothetical protein GCM10027259_51790 [Micromonospora palomenae]
MLAAVHETVRLAGSIAAHGIWSVSDGETLVPLFGYEQADGSRGMDRFVLEDGTVYARAAEERLQGNQHGSAASAQHANAPAPYLPSSTVGHGRVKRQGRDQTSGGRGGIRLSRPCPLWTLAPASAVSAPAARVPLHWGALVLGRPGHDA